MGAEVLGKVLGGTFGYLQAGLVSVFAIAAIWLWRDYTGAKADVSRLEGEVTDLQGQVESKDGTIASMTRTAGRRNNSAKESEGLGNDILEAPDGTACARSAPIRIALDGLRDTSGAAASVDTVADVPVLAGADPADAE